MKRCLKKVIYLPIVMVNFMKFSGHEITLKFFKSFTVWNVSPLQGNFTQNKKNKIKIKVSIIMLLFRSLASLAVVKLDWHFSKKISRKGSWNIFLKIHEIYETFKHENFIAHFYLSMTCPIDIRPNLCYTGTTRVCVQNFGAIYQAVTESIASRH